MKHPPAPYARKLWIAQLERQVQEGALPELRHSLSTGPEGGWDREDFKPALLAAAKANWARGVKTLLDAGAPVDLSVWRAAARGGPFSIEALGESSAALEALISAPPCQEFQSPLAIACAFVHARSVRLLLLWGADPLSADFKGRHPIHEAAQSGSLPVIEFLLAAGADPSAGDHQGGQPSHNAAYANRIGALRRLARAGADLDAPTRFGDTPLNWACAGHSERAIKLLAGRGARLDGPGSPLEVALQRSAMGLPHWSTRVDFFEAEKARRERRELARQCKAAPPAPRRPRV